MVINYGSFYDFPHLFDKLMNDLHVSRNFVFDVRRITYAQPRTIGVRLSWDF